jgi:hypothetical protein
VSELDRVASEVALRTPAGARLNGNGHGKPLPNSPDELRAQLTERLGLADVGLEVVSATVFGRALSASVDLRLSGGQTITFERYADVTKPAILAAYLATTVGVSASFKGPDAIAVAVLIQRLADHQDEASADEAAREWGCEFLRIAPTLELDLGDQAERWQGFAALATLNPGKDAGEDRSAAAYAAATTVLIDRASGERLVRAGWMLAFVRREVGITYKPADLSIQMLRVGWERRASEGWVKATSPTGDRKPLRWRFYIVASGWEDQ